MIHLTPHMLADLYEVLRKTPPFKGWRMPHADEVGFHVSGVEEPQGEYWFEDARHHLRVSAKRHHTLLSAIMTLAHEMCHMREKMLGLRQDTQHGSQFWKLARLVCKRHSFDLGQF